MRRGSVLRVTRALSSLRRATALQIMAGAWPGKKTGADHLMEAPPRARRAAGHQMGDSAAGLI